MMSSQPRPFVWQMIREAVEALGGSTTNDPRLRRPLTFFDVETTGVDPRCDRIVEIALMKFAPGAEPRTQELRFNPEQPITAASSAIHGIRDEHVASCPIFADRVKRIAGFANDSDLGGFGIARFDLPFLVTEFERAVSDFPLHGRKVVDAMSLFHRLEPRASTPTPTAPSTTSWPPCPCWMPCSASTRTCPAL
jgi:DNA polymerase III epsilon subunit-like protein